MARESLAATIELADQLFKKPSWLTSAADEDDAWEKTLLKLMEYLNAVKKPKQDWRQVLHNHFVRRKVAPSAIGDVRMGDEQPRVQPPPRQSSAGLQDEPPVGPQQQQQRDKMITDLLMMEIAAHGAAWPFMLHRGRWRLLRRLCHPGSLKSWVQAQPQFKIIEDSMQRWGITRT